MNLKEFAAHKKLIANTFSNDYLSPCSNEKYHQAFSQLLRPPRQTINLHEVIDFMKSEECITICDTPPVLLTSTIDSEIEALEKEKQ